MLDSFTCPKCSYEGTMDELSCRNCGNSMQLNQTENNKSMQCSVCGIVQTAPCPTGCGADITIHTTTKSQFFQWVILGGIVIFGYVACSG